MFTYDTNGLTRTRQYTSANSVAVDASVRVEGWQTTSIDGLGKQTVSMVDVDGNVVSVTDHDGATTTYAYSARGDLETITDHGGHQIVNVYGNESAQPTQMTDPDLGTITYQYDSAGRLEEQTDARGTNLHIDYNLASQPTQILLDSAAGDPVVSSWAYDGSGRLTSATHHNLMVSGTSNGTVTTGYTYDLRNRVTQRTWTIPGLPGGPLDVDYSYRPLGGIDTVTYPDGSVVDYAYNPSTEQPVSVTLDGVTMASGVRYTPAGQVEFIQRGVPDWTSADLAQLATSFTFDDLQRIDEIATVGLAEPDSTGDALIRAYRGVLGRQADTAGWGYWLPQLAGGLPLANITQVFHDSTEFSTTWAGYVDSDSGLTLDVSINADFVNWAYDHIQNRPVSARAVSLWVDRIENQGWTRGQVLASFINDSTARNNPAIGGADATTAYLTPAPAAADVPLRLDHDWDAAGNLTRRHDTSVGVDQWSCFTYDDLHRLDLGYTRSDANCGAYQAVGPDPFNVDYGYDLIGNITTAAGTGTVSGSYTYSSTKPHAVVAAGANSYGYDAAGNMTTRTTSMGTQTLVYDALNRLVAIDGAGADMDALYDAEGTRVRRTLDGDVTFYLTDSYEHTDPATGTVSIHLTLAGQSVGSVIDGDLHVSATDHLGSGSVSRDTAGVTDTQRYTPYGAIRGGGGNTLPSDFTFTGQTDDPGTGLIDYNARHYDPQLGRFIMADPVLDGLNRYSYVRGNPLRWVDPTGRCQSYSKEDGCVIYGNGWNYNARGTNDVMTTEAAIASIPDPERVANEYGTPTPTPVPKHPSNLDACAVAGFVDCIGAAIGLGVDRITPGDYDAPGLGFGQVDEIGRYAIGEGERFGGSRSLDKAVQINYANAYRHTLWLALLTQAYGGDDALIIALSHEDGPVNQQSGSDDRVDVLNNQIGVDIGERLGPNATRDEIGRAVEQAFDDGLLWCRDGDTRIRNC